MTRPAALGLSGRQPVHPIAESDPHPLIGQPKNLGPLLRTPILTLCGDCRLPGGSGEQGVRHNQENSRLSAPHSTA